jgi:hypothetical protein
MIKKNCKICGKEFSVQNYRKKAQYCSIECKQKGMRKTNIIQILKDYAVIIINDIYFKIDKEDIEKIKNIKFHTQKMSCGIYARSSREGSKYLHQIIMDTPKGMHTDHINRDTTDNRKSNLRICTHFENMSNKRNNSNIVGVRFRPEKNKYEARIGINGKIKILGLYTEEKDAIKARKEGEKKYYGKICSC